ncbi:MAG TPA: hypothetical protein VMN79_04685 [Casimicrobiaceae bacterium]|nr:hypothetical protein [Casimicrobiaceae bacterium]
MAIYRALATNPVIPWRLRHGMERWLESSCRDRQPGLYRWLHFGAARDPLHAVTTGPAHHFFGYYDKCPWNASQSLLLAHEASFNDRPPGPEDRVSVGVVHVAEGNRYEALATTPAWNWQQGSMLQWHPADPERLLLHNDRRDGRFAAIVRDTGGRTYAVYDRPIYAIGPDGGAAYSVNFARLYAHRPGYGYAGGEDPWSDSPHPGEDGIHRIDLASGRSELIVSLDELSRLGDEAWRGAFAWINHVQVSPDGGRIAFFHIRRTAEGGWRARLCCCSSNGSQLACLLDAEVVSHYDWLDAERMLIWAKERGAPGRFRLVERSGGSRPIGAGVLVEDGHVSFSPDRSWVLNDTYPDRYDMRALMLYRWPDGERVDLARLHSPKARWWGETRCDLHPRWSRDGRRICIDSVHSGQRQMYVMDVGGLIG